MNPHVCDVKAISRHASGWPGSLCFSQFSLGMGGLFFRFVLCFLFCFWGIVGVFFVGLFWFVYLFVFYKTSN